MPNLDSITFDSSGFDVQSTEPDQRIWRNAAGDVISLHYFDVKPDVNADLNSIGSVRARYRAAAIASGMALIETEVIRADDCKAIRVIVKARQPSSAMAYFGSLTVPFREFSYVITLQAIEQGITG